MNWAEASSIWGNLSGFSARSVTVAVWKILGDHVEIAREGEFFGKQKYGEKPNQKKWKDDGRNL